MYIPGSIPNNHQQPSPFLSHHHPNNFFSLNPDLLRELNSRYLQDVNTNANHLSTFLRIAHHHEHTHNFNILPTSKNNLSPFLRPTMSSSSILPTQTIPALNLNKNTIKKENFSSPIKKTNKWCSAHVRISWMIYEQQQQEQQHNSLDQIPNAKPILPSSPTDLPLPSAFNYRSSLNHSDTFGRMIPSLNTTFGGLGSLFSPIPTKIDRKSVTTINHDRARFRRDIRSLPSTIHNISSKKLDEINRKRSSATFISSNRGRSRSPHLSSSNLLNKNSSIEQQYLLSSATQTNTYYPIVSPATAALIQHEYFLNALRLSTANSNAKISLTNNEEITRRNPKTALSSISLSSSPSKKAKYSQNEKESTILSN